MIRREINERTVAKVKVRVCDGQRNHEKHTGIYKSSRTQGIRDLQVDTAHPRT